MRRRRIKNDKPEPEKKVITKRRILPIVLALIIISTGALSGYIIHIYNNELPPIDKLYNIEPSLITRVYARDGSVIQKYFAEQRNLVTFDRIPKRMIDALLSVEDRSFYNHWGVSSKDLTRAVVKNVIHGFGSEGASTITQQLARMLFLNRSVSIVRKIKEALTAIKIERLYSKNEILEMYLNQYDFGNRSFGIFEASKNYFNKDVEDLLIEECAFLAGLIQAPYRYSPTKYPERAMSRRNTAIEMMVANGKLNREIADSIKLLPIELDYSSRPKAYGQYFSEYVRQYLVDKYGDSTVYSGGLSVYTTLDPYVQKISENAIKEQCDLIQQRIDSVYNPEHSHFLEYVTDYYDDEGDSTAYKHRQIQAACIVLENNSGDMLAMVGGRDFNESKFNRAVQSNLQPGSAFKPFLYTAAIEDGYSPCDELWDTPVVYTIPGTKEWRPHNFDYKFLGKMSMREGFYRSRNLIAIKLMNMVQPQQAIFYAKKMGIKSRLSPDLSLAIGTSEVKMIDLASAYSVFPNGGVKVEPRFIYKVVDRYGNVLEENPVSEKEEVLNPQSAYIMIDLMKSTMDNIHGTGYGARRRGFYREAGGKTGTSDNFSDNWFSGYTPQITATVWVGFDIKLSIGKNATGARNGLPIWTKIMIAAHENIPGDGPEAHFKQPDGIFYENVCYDSGELATDKCTQVGREIFKARTLPTKHCHIHPSAGVYASPDKEEFNLNEPDTTDDGIQNW
jgi:penicillin-binding protein 1A